MLNSGFRHRKVLKIFRMFQKNFWENFQFDFYPIRWPDFWWKIVIFFKNEIFIKNPLLQRVNLLVDRNLTKIDKKMLTKPEFQSRIRDKENDHFQATCFEQDLENVTKFRPGHLTWNLLNITFFLVKILICTWVLVKIDNRC